MKWVKDYAVPTDILVETTTDCNLACVMCPHKKLSRPHGKMSVDLWKKIVSDIVKYFPDATLWPTIMGEPLSLGLKLFEYISYAHQAGLKKICLNTNLLLLTDNLLEPLLNSGISELIIGIDAATSETYAKIRVGGDFDVLKKNIRKIIFLNEQSPQPLKITLQMVLQDQNENETDMFINYWREQACGITLKIRHRIGWGGRIAPSRMIPMDQMHDRIPCLWLLRQMSILWNGLVPQCDSPSDLYYGDATKESLFEIWNNALKKIRERHFAGDFSMSPCNACYDWRVGKSKTIQL